MNIFKPSNYNVILILLSESIDETDLQILSIIQSNSKIGYKTISKITGLPLSTVHKKKKKLEEKQVIKNYITVLSEEKLGFTQIAIIGVETGALLYKNVALALTQIPEILEVYGTTAQYDLMIKIRTTDRLHLSEVLNNIRNIEGVNDINVASILEIFKEEYTLPLHSRDSPIEP